MANGDIGLHLKKATLVPFPFFFFDKKPRCFKYYQWNYTHFPKLTSTLSQNQDLPIILITKKLLKSKK